MPKLPSAANVPSVPLARDPGVRAPSGAFESSLGIAAEELQPAVKTFARITERRDGLARDAADIQYADQLSQKMAELEKEDKFSEEATIQEAADFSLKAQEDIRRGYNGTSIGRTALDVRMQRRRLAFTDKLAVRNIAAEESRQNRAIQDQINAIQAAVLEDPDLLTTDTPADVFTKWDARLEDAIEFIGLKGAAADSARNIGRQETAVSMISPLIGQGDFTRARQLITSDLFEKVLSPEVRRRMAARVNQSERDLTKARGEVQASLEKARLLLPPDATDDQIRRAASQLEGISQATNTQLFKIGGTIVGVDKGTGAIVNRIEVETPEQAAERAGAVEAAKLAASGNFLRQILSEAGADGLPVDENGDEDSSVVSPFGEDVPASEDAQSLNKLLLASRRLLLVGKTKEAGAFLAQARSLAENSPDIKREKELDKMLAPKVASEYGVKIGSTYRDIQGAMPRTPEAQAEAGAIARGRGAARIKGEAQLAFVDEARSIILDLQEELRDDPTLVGALGSARAAGQTAIEIMNDLGLRALGEIAQNIAEDNLGFGAITQFFDSPTLSTLKVIENSVGLILARIRNPSGRISVDIIQRSIDDVKLRGLTGSKQVANRLDFILKTLDRRASNIEQRFPTDNAEEQEKMRMDGMPRFRIENGELVEIQ